MPAPPSKGTWLFQVGSLTQIVAFSVARNISPAATRNEPEPPGVCSVMSRSSGTESANASDWIAALKEALPAVLI